MKPEDIRPGYYAVRQKNPVTGEIELVLRPHNAEVQQTFEEMLREGTRRRREENVRAEETLQTGSRL